MIFHPVHMGMLNRRALIRQLQKAGVASRAELARALGMSQPTAGKIVDELLTERILEEVEVAPDGNGSVQLGRPGRQLQLNRSQASFLGIQLGMQETQLVELTLGEMEEHAEPVAFPTPLDGRNPAAAWEKGLRAMAKKLNAEKFLCVLLSVPGVVDEAAKKILFSPNIHWSEGLDLAALIQQIWNVPVLLVQEERALALGHQADHPEDEDFLLVDFGDGVGGAVIVDGKPLASPLPISGELGHTPVLGNHRRCGCGAVGCVETLVSTRGLLQSFAEAHPGQKADWERLANQIAAKGVEPWLAPALEAAAIAIAGALNVLGLRRVIVTGTLTELSPAVLKYLAAAINKGAMWARFGEVDCVKAPRRRTMGLVAVGIDRFIAPETSHTK